MANGRKAQHRSHSLEWLFCLLAVLALAGCGEKDDRGDAVRLSGATMATTWNVTYFESTASPSPEEVHSAIQAELDGVNESMSTYREDSEITRFNNEQAPGNAYSVSPGFGSVLAAALDIGTASDGALDITVGPLVDLWGFGAAGDIVTPPSSEAIASAQGRVGQESLVFDPKALTLTKLMPVALDVSSLAKGYAVDKVAQWLTARGINDYLVEVGGEMRLAGLSPRGTPWRIAIEQPEAGARSVAGAILLSDVSVATSGDYRNYFEADGKRYSHTIDPRTGYPVDHDLVSVTVVHPSAMQADAWATAFTVLGTERGRAVAEARSLAVYFIQRGADGFVHSHTPQFARYLEDAVAGSHEAPAKVNAQ